MINAVKLVEYNTWANKKLLEQTEMLPGDQFTKVLGGSFPSIQLTFCHLLESDWIWMHRWKGIPMIAAPSNWSTDNAYAIHSIWMPIQNEMEEIANGLATNSDKTIAFTTKKGASFSMPFEDIVMHVTNHGTYHRGQIVNMIRMLGVNPVNTDYFIFCTLHAR